MISRRLLIAASLPAAVGGRAAVAADSFQGFVAGVKAEARKSGISAHTLDAAFAGVAPNQKVLERDRHQPEFTMTWARYKTLVINEKRIADGRQSVVQNQALLRQVEGRYGVGTDVTCGIWGLESGFGQITGDFRVVEALATLAWEGRRASFFRGELMAALKILEHGDVVPGRMTGSYAGALGQPQFMPSSYLRYAVDFEGHGRRDIWTSKGDVLGSIANYLAKSGWRGGETWGQQVALPPRFDATLIGRETKRPLAEWARLGVAPIGKRWRTAAEAPASVLAPDGMDGEAFVVFGNFAAIRRYNPSDFYALGVGLLGDLVLA